jgi:hypothetical protein
MVDDGGNKRMIAYLFSLNKDANIADQWDFGMLKDILDKNGFEQKLVTKLPKTERAIVVLPARHHAGMELEVNKHLKKIDHVVLFLMGDEEADYDVSLVDHPSIHIWVQNPHIGVHDEYNKIGTGFPEHYKKILDDMEMPEKELDIFYAGQMTHERRVELNDALVVMPTNGVKYLSTRGFTQGLEHTEYATMMARAKIAPAPSGAVIPDSFRLFEALEAMAIPIADEKTASGEIMYYWDWLFGQITPFPKIQDWNSLQSYKIDVLENYPKIMHVVTAWYIKWKRDLNNKIMEQYNG